MAKYLSTALPNKDCQIGATMVEFALTSIFLLFIFGAFIDIGLGIHRYALLKQVTTEATRQVAARLQTHRECSLIRAHLEQNATRKATEGLKLIHTPVWTMTWYDRGTRNGHFPVMSIRGDVRTNCYFLCTLSPGGWPLHASSEIVIERSGAGGFGMSCPSFTTAPTNEVT